MRNTSLLVAAVAATLAFSQRVGMYPKFAPAGRAMPNNRLPPRKDKGSAYRFVAMNRLKPNRLTRIIVA